MACNVKLNVIEQFKNDGLIKEGNREILDVSEFEAANERYTEHAKRLYGIQREDKLFEIEVADRGKLRTRTVLRAIPNEDFFNQIDTIQNPVIEGNVKKQMNLVSLSKPVLEFQFLSNEELVNSDKPRENKTIQDNLRKEVEDLENLIDCLWS